MSIKKQAGLFAGMAIAWMGVAGMAAAASAMGASPTDPKDGPGKDLFVQRCSVCHDPSNATARRLSHDEWREIVQRMIQYGAAVTEPESETIVDYLTKSYGADPAPTAPSSHSSG